MTFSVQVPSLLYQFPVLYHNICLELCSHTFSAVLIFWYYTTPLSVQKASIILWHLVRDKLSKSHPVVWRGEYVIAEGTVTIACQLC